MSAIALAVAVPVGLLSAIYLSEYASPRARRIIKPILEILAGIPSVVLGFFALTFISPNFVQNLNPQASSLQPVRRPASASGILSIPLIASISEDAMRAVPRSLREASYGLGARRITTSLRVVVPAARLGHRRRGHHRRVADDRRDDDRGRRCGWIGRRPVHRQPVRARPDDHRGDGRARHPARTR